MGANARRSWAVWTGTFSEVRLQNIAKLALKRPPGWVLCGDWNCPSTRAPQLRPGLPPRLGQPLRGALPCSHLCGETTLGQSPYSIQGCPGSVSRQKISGPEKSKKELHPGLGS